MEPKLRAYIENLFSSAPHTKQAYELREEIIRNTIERFHDLLDDGKSEGDAFNLAIAGIGDINELLNELGAVPNNAEFFNNNVQNPIKGRITIFRTIAVIMYILCVSPILFCDAVDLNVSIGVCAMFLMISTATALLIYSNITKLLPIETNLSKRKQLQTFALLRACAVGGYISCAVPVIFFSEIYAETVGVILLFVVLAASTAAIILSSIFFPTKNTSGTMVESYNNPADRELKTQKAYRALTAVLWTVASFVYLFITIYGIVNISYKVGLVTWVIFIIAFAMQRLMRAIFDYLEAEE